MHSCSFGTSTLFRTRSNKFHCSPPKRARFLYVSTNRHLICLLPHYRNYVTVRLWWCVRIFITYKIKEIYCDRFTFNCIPVAVYVINGKVIKYFNYLYYSLNMADFIAFLGSILFSICRVYYRHFVARSYQGRVVEQNWEQFVLYATSVNF